MTNYSLHMIEIRETDAYSKWFKKLRDSEAKARVNIRLRRMALGNPGDAKPVGEGVSELRITYGPGYRIYFTKQDNKIVILLCGGNKSSQTEDIAKAKELKKDL